MAQCRSWQPSPSMIVALLALVIATGGSALASSPARNPNLSQDQKAIKAYVTRHVRRAVLSADGSIVAESGGIAVTAHHQGSGVYILGFSSRQTNKAVLSTTNSTGASTGITYVTATVCGGAASTGGLTRCPRAFNNAKYVQVSTYENGGSSTGNATTTRVSISRSLVNFRLRR